jgi:adenylosuccinate lyase
MLKLLNIFSKIILKALQLSEFKEFIHFGLTSQDINNTATPYLLKQFHQHVFLPKLDEVKIQYPNTCHRVDPCSSFSAYTWATRITNFDG